MNRNDFQRLADIRLREAKALLDGGHFPGAFYLSGYVVECAIKACIAKNTKRYDFPPNEKTVREFYKHNLVDLIKAASLDQQLKIRLQGKQFSTYWRIVSLWSEQSRYDNRRSAQEANDMYLAVSDPADGVLQWIKQYW